MDNPQFTGIWFLVGLASRMAVDHGLHHETSQSDNLTPLELDMNRRLFYSVFNLDRLLCHALGRPPSIPDTFVSVPVSRVDKLATIVDQSKLMSPTM